MYCNFITQGVEGEVVQTHLKILAWVHQQFKGGNGSKNWSQSEKRKEGEA